MARPKPVNYECVQGHRERTDSCFVEETLQHFLCFDATSYCCIEHFVLILFAWHQTSKSKCTLVYLNCLHTVQAKQKLLL